MNSTDMMTETMRIRPFFKRSLPGAARVAVLMSGSGTNAEALFRFCRERSGLAFEPVVIVTDAPETSRAAALGREFGVPVAALDIKAFYRSRGEEAIALTTPRRREIREEWTDELRRLMAPYRVDFAVLAGFVPLTNLTDDLPCLNVHPGDLTIERDGRRLLAGLHFRPVEQAILAGFPTLRSSVILAQPYRGSGAAEMDSGPVLGVSRPMAVDLEGHPLEELARICAARQHGPFHDELRRIAVANLERLKVAGDHVVLPRVTADFAAGRFGVDEEGRLCFLRDGKWLVVRTVEYSVDRSEPVLP